MKRGSFAAGFLTCLLLAGITTTAYAAGIMAERSHHRIVVDGKEAQMEAYVINGNNYVRLADIGKQVGFNVYWDSNTKTVQIEADKPYTGIAPQQTAAAPTDGSRYVPKVGDVIRCDDGTDYTITDVSRWEISPAGRSAMFRGCPRWHYTRCRAYGAFHRDYAGIGSPARRW